MPLSWERLIATGHYANIHKNEGQFQLLRGIDAGKDQSYFLYMLNQEQLSKSVFPIGCLEKPEVRTKAKKLGFLNFDKKDSVFEEIFFLIILKNIFKLF